MPRLPATTATAVWGGKDRAPEIAVEESRLPDQDKILPTFMAMYTRQHLVQGLEKRGLLAFGTGHGAKARWHHPIEIARLLGFPPSLKISANKAQASHDLGNAISPAHAMYVSAARERARRTNRQSRGGTLMEELRIPLHDLREYTVRLQEDWQSLEKSRKHEKNATRALYHSVPFAYAL